MAEVTEKPEKQHPLNNSNAEALKKKKKRKDFAPFGNYRSYYGYRVGNNVEEDPRFKVLRKEWFEDKDCLDIGCNSGLITIHIAKKFLCRTILGIDIDRGKNLKHSTVALTSIKTKHTFVTTILERINDAVWHLKHIANKEKTRIDCLKVSKSKEVEGVNDLKCAGSCSTSPEDTRMTSSSVEKNLCGIVSFRCENFVSSWRALPLEYYDTIVCLSVTKWVHLNWGDEGLIILFAKMWRLLHPGGILVLEPQPWESYYKNRLTTETTQINYSKIRLKPEGFQEILLDKIGFRSVEHVTTSVEGATVGFDRPVLVFRK